MEEYLNSNKYYGMEGEGEGEGEGEEGSEWVSDFTHWHLDFTSKECLLLQICTYLFVV